MKSFLAFLFLATSLQAADLSDLTWEVSLGEVTITDCKNTAKGELEIPSSIGGYPVTTISTWSFQNCSCLTRVTIPDSVSFIHFSAFENCTSLTSIAIPDSVSTIRQAAFQNCANLHAISFGGPPPSDIYSPPFSNLHPKAKIKVWPAHSCDYGGEGALWQGFSVSLRDTTPKITSLSIGESTTTVSVSGGPDSFDILNHSIDLNTFTRVLTTPAIIKTDSNGITTFSVDTTGDNGFFILE